MKLKQIIEALTRRDFMRHTAGTAVAASPIGKLLLKFNVQKNAAQSIITNRSTTKTFNSL